MYSVLFSSLTSTTCITADMHLLENVTSCDGIAADTDRLVEFGMVVADKSPANHLPNMELKYHRVTQIMWTQLLQLQAN